MGLGLGLGLGLVEWYTEGLRDEDGRQQARGLHSEDLGGVCAVQPLGQLVAARLHQLDVDHVVEEATHLEEVEGQGWGEGWG